MKTTVNTNSKATKATVATASTTTQKMTFDEATRAYRKVKTPDELREDIKKRAIKELCPGGHLAEFNEYYTDEFEKDVAEFLTRVPDKYLVQETLKGQYQAPNAQPSISVFVTTDEKAKNQVNLPEESLIMVQDRYTLLWEKVTYMGDVIGYRFKVVINTLPRSEYLVEYFKDLGLPTDKKAVGWLQLVSLFKVGAKNLISFKVTQMLYIDFCEKFGKRTDWVMFCKEKVGETYGIIDNGELILTSTNPRSAEQVYIRKPKDAEPWGYRAFPSKQDRQTAVWYVPLYGPRFRTFVAEYAQVE